MREASDLWRGTEVITLRSKVLQSSSTVEHPRQLAESLNHH